MKKFDSLEEYNKRITSLWDWSDRGFSSYAGSITIEQANVMEDIILETNTKSMLEIGFNCGFSSFIWLLSNVEYLQSVDVAGSDNGVRYLKNQFINKFNFLRKDSKLLERNDFNMDFDSVFIDGDHSVGGVINDINKSFLFNPKFLIFDDYLHSHHGPDIKFAINQFSNKLEFYKEYSELPGFGVFKVNYK